MTKPVFLDNGDVVIPCSDPAVTIARGYRRYWLAVDLGQAHDYTAYVIVRDEALPRWDTSIQQSVGPRERVVVAADRFRGVSYPDVVDHLVGILQQPQFLGKTSLCIDGTAMGRVVSDILQEQGIEHHAIQMTGGQEWSRKGRYANVSKTLMIETLSVQFASGELKFARDLTLRKEIEEDLASFTLKTTAAGNQVITQSRTSAGHGDLGIALAIAAFASQHFVQGYIGQSTLRGYW